jgi:hypothetical protein
MNGAQYKGEWRDDLQHGEGVETWTDKSRYEGEYEYGRKHGVGSYQWNDGSLYTGDWRENKISGVGVYSWLDGRHYEGEWHENNMEGMGIYVWSDGRVYQGQYREDKKHGFGVYTWQDGRRYEGYWYRGKQHGLGIYFQQKDQKPKYGLWEDGKRIQWFNEMAQVEAIAAGTFDYSQYFFNADSETMIERDASFSRPPYFDQKLSELKKKIHKLTSRFQTDKQPAPTNQSYHDT